jgi:hypothetical protein
MSAVPVLPRQIPPDHKSQQAYAPWTGLIAITIRNISKGVIRLEEVGITAEFRVEVLDSAGQPAPFTDEGKRASHNSHQFQGAHSVSLIQLVPLEATTMTLDVSRRIEIKQGQAYRVTIRRSEGLPLKDEGGKPLKDVEVGCTFEVPDYGILKQ